MPHSVEILYTRRPPVFSRRLWDHHFNSLPPSCRNYILKFHRPEDRQDRLLARLLIRKALIDRGFSHECLRQVRLDENQRPFINRKIDFNIAHSGTLIVCAIAGNCRVGIDIEKHSPVKFSDTISSFPTLEQKLITSSHNPIRNFFDLWTIRESIVKTDGRGLLMDMAEIKPMENQYHIGSSRYFPIKLEIAAGYSCHFTTNLEHIVPTLSELPSLDDL